MADHLGSGIPQHLKILAERVQNLELVTGQKRGLPQGQNSLSERITTIENNVASHGNQFSGGGKGASHGSAAVPGAASGGVGPNAVAAIKETLNIYEGVITVLNREVEKLTVQVSDSERKHCHDLRT